MTLRAGSPGHDENGLEPLVVLNARPDDILLDVPGLDLQHFTLHPNQAQGSDDVVKSASV